MKGYCIFDNVRVHDLEKMEIYKEKALAILQNFEGHYLIIGGQFTVVEGSMHPTFLVMIEFPSYERALQWYYSEEYKELKAMRILATESNGIIVQGL